MHYHYPYETTFPDPAYLNELIEEERRKFEMDATPLEKLVVYSGTTMNWISDFILDPGISWRKEELPIDELYLTGTTPEWNKIIIEDAARNPQLLRNLLASKSEVRALFGSASWNEKPILFRKDENRNKVFDGMNRVIAGILDGRTQISAYIGELIAPIYQPVCEPHVVYDLLRSYFRTINTDRNGLLAALRFLRKSYANVDTLLKHRFNFSGIPDEEIQRIIQEALQD